MKIWLYPNNKKNGEKNKKKYKSIYPDSSAIPYCIGQKSSFHNFSEFREASQTGSKVVANSRGSVYEQKLSQNKQDFVLSHSL